MSSHNSSASDLERRWPPSLSFMQGWDRRFRDHGNFGAHRRRNPEVLPLVNLCVRVLAEHIEEVSTEALESLQLKHVCSLYDEVISRGMSFRSWKLFSYALPKRTGKIPLGAYTYYRDIEPPFARDLSVYTGPLTSPTVDFICSLHISDASSFKVNDLLTLADMQNLGVLTLHAYGRGIGATPDEIRDSPVSDRLLRGWSEKERPFPLLRVLDLITSASLTFHALRYASKFPSLTYFYLASDTLDRHQAWRAPKKIVADLGWTQHRTRPPHPHLDGNNLSGDSTVSLSPRMGGDHTESSSNSEHWSATLHLPLDSFDAIARSRLLKWSSYLAQGEGIHDADLLHQGINLSYQASLFGSSEANVSGTSGKPLLLPPKPLAYVHLYTQLNQDKMYDKPTRQAWFTREFTPTMSLAATNAVTEDDYGKRKSEPPKLRPGKRQNLGDLLQY